MYDITSSHQTKHPISYDIIRQRSSFLPFLSHTVLYGNGTVQAQPMMSTMSTWWTSVNGVHRSLYHCDCLLIASTIPTTLLHRTSLLKEQLIVRTLTNGCCCVKVFLLWWWHKREPMYCVLCFFRFSSFFTWRFGYRSTTVLKWPNWHDVNY